MSTQSSIEWTDTTWNPVRGCSKVSAGCTNCYAMRQAHRFSGEGKPYEGLTHVVKGKGPQWTGAVRTVPELLEEPLRWRRPRRVFVNSMSDLFHEDVRFEFIDRVFAVMALAPRHTFQVLTKRPERMAAYMTSVPSTLDRNRGDVVADIAAGSGQVIWDGRGSDPWRYPNGPATHRLEDRRAWSWPLPNVWLGTSVEDQAAADERIPHLLRTPAVVRFISAEPLLAPVDLTRINLGECAAEFVDRPEIKRARFTVNALAGAKSIDWPGLSWVIVGGESGPGARPCDVAWIRGLVEQCRAAGVPVFVKQLGARPYMAGQAFAAGLSIGVECEHGYDVCPKCDAADVQLDLRDRKGGDPEEWPSDLRIRQWPREATHGR